MQVRHVIALLALTASAATGAARADTIYTVTATYDPFITGDTTFTIDNLSASTLSGVDITSGSASKPQLDIAPQSSETYTFDDLLGGPFVQQPGGKGVPDTTGYQITANVAGQAITTALFSPVSNLTGHYVDFLGACFNNQGCSEDPTVQYDLSGVVAQGASPVPLPPALALFGCGLVALAGRLRRRVQA